LFKAVVVNSGNANCMTGERGLDDAGKMIAEAARRTGLSEEEVLVSSTGIIGQYMPMKKILKGMGPLARGLNEYAVEDAAEGIMTTDRFPKISSRKFSVKGTEVKICGIAKGAGMIHPNMATMLCYIVTDASLSKYALKKALRTVNEDTFNSITVDGDMSTNDTVMLMANGAAGNRMIKQHDKEYGIFMDKLGEICAELSRMVVLDGEGSTRIMKVRVKGASGKNAAKRTARSIAGSILVKCAVLGGDPNWGRVASSAGACRSGFDPEKAVIKLDGVVFFRKGRPVRDIDRKASKVFKGKEVSIELDLGQGSAEAEVLSCDISRKYITLNSYYTT
jgi:glutamate N-acetyltransferase/amino-acid N-acetyltransferase